MATGHLESVHIQVTVGMMLVRLVVFDPDQLLRRDAVLGTDHRGQLFREVGNTRARIVREFGADHHDAAVSERLDAKPALALAPMKPAIPTDVINGIHATPPLLS